MAGTRLTILTVGTRGDVQPHIALGAGPRPIPQKKLSVESLAQAIHLAVTDEPMRRRAEALGQKIRAEDGAAQAVQIISGRLHEATGNSVS